MTNSERAALYHPLPWWVRVQGTYFNRWLRRHIGGLTMQSAVKLIIRALGRKLCARILWLPVARYMRLRLKHLQSGRIRLA